VPTHLLDTCVYSERLRPQPHPGIVRNWRRLGDEAVCVSAVCEAELLFGLERRGSPRLWTEYREFLEGKILVLPLDRAVAVRFGGLKAAMERKGKPRADFDLLIAATALDHGLILVTSNPRHFEDLPGLKVEDWTAT
jgi:tRNA(fMet)-specific endonuclease VapC